MERMWTVEEARETLKEKAWSGLHLGRRGHLSLDRLPRILIRL
jgi:hypothetical protein